VNSVLTKTVAATGLLLSVIATQAGTGRSDWAPSLKGKTYVIEKLSNGWRVMSPGKPYSITRSEVARHSGGSSIRFELRGGEAWNAEVDPSFRSEISTDEYVAKNSVQWYGFSLLIPQDFPIETNRCVIGQWHDKAKTQLGEPDKSPEIAHRFSNGRFYVTARHSTERIVSDPDAVPQEVLFETTHFPLGQWNDFVYQIKWSYHRNGFVNAWLNGKQIINYHGPVGYDDDIGPVFNFGIYRDETDKTYVVYFDQYRRGNSFAEVDPSKQLDAIRRLRSKPRS